MESVSENYASMKKYWRTYKSQHRERSFVDAIMEVAVSVNFKIQQVMMMEQYIHRKYQYLDTVYRLLVFSVLPNQIKEFINSIIRDVFKPEEFLASRAAIAFMGDIVEIGFRNPSYPSCETDPIVTKFCSQWKLDATTIDTFVEEWKLLVRREAPLLPEIALNPEFHECFAELGFKSHLWLSQFKYIGGDCSLMHTIRILQSFEQPLVNDNSFGRQWDETWKATKIWGTWMYCCCSIYFQHYYPCVPMDCYQQHYHLNRSS